MVYQIADTLFLFVTTRSLNYRPEFWVLQNGELTKQENTLFLTSLVNK